MVKEIFETNKYQSPCYSANLSGVMYPEGQVYPCEILDSSHIIGNIREPLFKAKTRLVQLRNQVSEVRILPPQNT